MSAVVTPIHDTEFDARKMVIGEIFDHVRQDVVSRCVVSKDAAGKPIRDDKGRIIKNWFPEKDQVMGRRGGFTQVTPELLVRHLTTENNDYRLGVYPVNAGADVTRVSVVDVDDHEGTLGWDEVNKRSLEISSKLIDAGLKPYAVVSGGGNGIHLWVLYDKPIPVARNHVLLKRCVEAAGYTLKGIDLLPSRNAVAVDKFGSVVSLPFANNKPAWNLVTNSEVPAGVIEVSSPIALPEVEMPSKAPSGAPIKWSNENAAKVQSALNWLDPDGYNEWFQTVLILYRASEGNAEGEMLARQWSARSPKYDPLEFDKMWAKDVPKAADRDGPKLGLGSLFKWAADRGWSYMEESRSSVVANPGKSIAHNPVELARMVDELQEKMAALTPPPVFNYGGYLAKVVAIGEEAIGGVDEKLYPKDASRVVLFEHRALSLKLAVNRHIEFVEWRQDDEGKPYCIVIPTPAEPVSAWLQSSEYAGLPKLGRLVSSPVLRSDGSLIDTMGYDPATGIYRVGDAEGWDDIEPATTPAELARCLETMYEPIRDFVLEGPHARTAVAIAMLGGITRHLYGASPGVLVSAPGPDSGKTLLVKILLACSGGFVGVAPASLPKDNEEEIRKYIISLAKAGVPYLWFDNVKGGLDSPSLEAWHSTGAVAGRVLGVSETVDLHWRAMAYYTVQDDSVSLDLLRRNLGLRINPGVENPGARPASAFAHPDMEEWVRLNWKTVNMAALRLLRGYMLAVPEGERAKPSGTWVEWGRWTQNPINWAIGLVAGAGLGKVERQDSPIEPSRPVLAWGFEPWDACSALSQRVGSSESRSMQGGVLYEIVRWLEAPLDKGEVSKPTMSFTASDVVKFLTVPSNQRDNPALWEMLSYRDELAKPGKVTKLFKPMCDLVIDGRMMVFEPGTSRNIVGKYKVMVKGEKGWTTVGMPKLRG